MAKENLVVDKLLGRVDSSNSTGKQTEEIITLKSTSNEDIQVLEAEPLATNETDGMREDHKVPSLTSTRETSTIPQNFEPKILPSGGGAVLEGFHKEHKVDIYSKKLNP